jgi:hypothetical protein
MAEHGTKIRKQESLRFAVGCVTDEVGASIGEKRAPGNRAIAGRVNS